MCTGIFSIRPNFRSCRRQPDNNAISLPKGLLRSSRVVPILVLSWGMQSEFRSSPPYVHCIFWQPLSRRFPMHMYFQFNLSVHSQGVRNNCSDRQKLLPCLMQFYRSSFVTALLRNISKHLFLRASAHFVLLSGKNHLLPSSSNKPLTLFQPIFVSAAPPTYSI